MAKKILKGVTSVFPLGAIGLASKIFGGKKKPKPAPVEEKPAVMPVADDEAVRRAKRKSIIQQRARRGRESTILTGDTLGGG